jgi:hypothetical protein
MPTNTAVIKSTKTVSRKSNHIKEAGTSNSLNYRPLQAHSSRGVSFLNANFCYTTGLS